MAPMPIRPITIDGRTGKPPAPPKPAPAPGHNYGGIIQPTPPPPPPPPAPTPAPGHNYGGIIQPAPPPPKPAPAPPKPAPAPGHNYGGIIQPAPAPTPTPPVSTIPQAGGFIHTDPVPNKPLVPPQRTPVGTPVGTPASTIPRAEPRRFDTGYLGITFGSQSPRYQNISLRPPARPTPTAPMPEGYVPFSPMPEGYVPFSSEPGSRDLNLETPSHQLLFGQYGARTFNEWDALRDALNEGAAMEGGGGAAAASGGGDGTSPGGAAGDTGDGGSGGGGGSVEEAVERAANDTEGILPSLVPDDAPMPVEESIALADLLDKIVVNMMPGDIFEIPAGLQRALAAQDPNGQFVRLFDRILRALGFEPLGDIGLFGFNTDYFVPTVYAWSDEAMLIMQNMEAQTRKLMERLLKALLGKALLEQRFASALAPAQAQTPAQRQNTPQAAEAAELPVPPQVPATV